MEAILNRWRGTGIMFWKVTGVHLYALYIFLVLVFLTKWYWALLGALLFMFGESMSWGKWVGFLTSDNGVKEYDNKTGKSFPWIHYTANFFIKQEYDYLNYCRLALAIRGFYWWAPLQILLFSIGLIPFTVLIINLIILSFGFPIACELSKKWNYTLQSRWLNMSVGWENQEIIYGFLQFLTFTLCLFVFNII